jgi:hypothetical protein
MNTYLKSWLLAIANGHAKDREAYGFFDDCSDEAEAVMKAADLLLTHFDYLPTLKYKKEDNEKRSLVY